MTEEETVKVETKKSNTEFYFKVVTGFLFVMSWIVLIGLRISTGFSLTIPLFVSIFLTLVFIASMFGKRISELLSKEKDKNTIPEPISEEELAEIIKSQVNNRLWAYIEEGVPITRWSYNINGNLIYRNHVRLYNQEYFNGDLVDEVIIIVNANYPKMQPTILSPLTPEEKIERAVNLMSTNPRDDPDIEREIIENPFTGVRSTKVRQTHHRKEEEKEKEDSII